MKLLAIILTASISISSVLPSTGDVTSSVLPSTGDVTDHECPEGYEKVGEDCRETAEKISACPADEGDQCYVDNNYCRFDWSFPKVRDLTDYRCNEGFSYIEDSFLCESESGGVDHGVPEYKCLEGLTEINDKCVQVRDPIAVCSEDSSASSPGCYSRSYKYNAVIGCIDNYEVQVNSDGDKLCVFKEGSETSFCLTNSQLDPITNKCVYKLTLMSKAHACDEGRVINGRCIERDQEDPQYLCPLKSDLAGNVGACYKGTVEETNKGVRCLVTSTTLQRVQVCPAGFFEFKNKCVSHLTTITTAASE